MTEKAVIYARVSSDRQEREGYSLESQVEACERYIEEQGGAVNISGHYACPGELANLARWEDEQAEEGT